MWNNWLVCVRFLIYIYIYSFYYVSVHIYVRFITFMSANSFAVTIEQLPDDQECDSEPLVIQHTFHCLFLVTDSLLLLTDGNCDNHDEYKRSQHRLFIMIYLFQSLVSRLDPVLFRLCPKRAPHPHPHFPDSDRLATHSTVFVRVYVCVRVFVCVPH